MIIKVPYKYGKILYLVNDPEQLPHEFVGIVAGPGFIKYKLSYCGDEVDVYDFQTSEDRDPTKMFGLTENDGKD